MPPMSYIEQWFALAEKYGVSLVLLGLLIIGLIIFGVSLFKWLRKMFDIMFDKILSVKQVLPDPAQENVAGMVGLNMEIKSCLKDVMTDLHGDWGQMWCLHNGIHGIGASRVPFMFLALTHQVSDDGTLADLQSFGQLPLSLFDDFMISLMSREIVEFKESLVQFPTAMNTMIRELGAKTSIARGVRDKNNQIIGFSMMLWKSETIISEGQNLIFMNGCMQMASILAGSTTTVQEVSRKS